MPKFGPFALADLAQGLARFERLARRVDLTEPWRHPRRRGARRADLRDLDPPQPAHPTGRGYFRVGVRGGVRGRRRGPVAAARAVLRHSGTDFETLLIVDRGAQQDRVVGGSVRIAEAMAAGSGTGSVSGTPVRRSATTAPGSASPPERGERFGRRYAVVTLPPTLAGRLDYDPLLPAVARPAHPAPPGRIGDQDLRRLRRAVLASRGPQRPGGLRHGAGQGHLRQLPARRAGSACSWGSSRAATRAAGPAYPGGAARGRPGLLRALLRPPRRRPTGVRRARLDGRGVHPRLLRRPLHARRVDPATATRSATRSAASTGRGPSAHRCGTATWRGGPLRGTPPRRAPSARLGGRLRRITSSACSSRAEGVPFIFPVVAG